jgi:predicted  nucleic acid-binding Zn-ribbon protein
MSCMTHDCRTCGHEWFNNSRAGGLCPKCGSDEVYSTFDEPAHDDRDDDREDEVE